MAFHSCSGIRTAGILYIRKCYTVYTGIGTRHAILMSHHMDARCMWKRTKAPKDTELHMHKHA